MSLTVTSFIPGIVAGAQPIRKTDVLTFPFPAAPQAMSIYVRFQEQGNSKVGSGIPRLLIIGAASGTPAVGLYITYNGGYGSRYINKVGGAALGSTVTSPLPTIGEMVELLVTLTSAGITQTSQAINGGAVTAAGAAAAGVLPQTWAAQTLAVCPNGQAAFTHLLIVRGVQTMQTMRKYAGVA